MSWIRPLAVATTALTLVSTALAGAVLKVNGVEATPGQLAIARYKVTDDAPSLAGDEAAVTRAAKDLLIADMKMPGNWQLELIRHLPQLADGMAVILMAGYTSPESKLA